MQSNGWRRPFVRAFLVEAHQIVRGLTRFERNAERGGLSHDVQNLYFGWTRSRISGLCFWTPTYTRARMMRAVAVDSTNVHSNCMGAEKSRA